MAEMRFDIGDRVKIAKKGGINGKYYYDEGCGYKIPLGTRGVVSQICPSYIKVRVKKVDYFFDHREVVLDEDIEIKDINGHSQLVGLLEAEEPSSGDKSLERKAFNPKFNPREEFAVWVRQEFPELKEYSVMEKKYSALIDRQDEVMKGAKQAYSHIKKTETRACAFDSFSECFSNLSLFGLSGKSNFARTLNNFVGFIESTSANLPADYKHHGTIIARNM